MADHKINNQIMANNVRLVTDVDQTLLTLREALAMAESVGLDLVQFGEGSPPVVKLVNYSKFKFEQAKKKKEADKKARTTRTDLKELQFRPATDSADLERLIRHANEFLSHGDKVRLVCKFRGREVAYRAPALERMYEIIDKLTGTLDGVVGNQGRSITAIVRP